MTFLILTLISFFAQAADEIRLSYQVSKNQSLNQVVFFVQTSQIKRWQNTNFFSRDNDAKLGKMDLVDNRLAAETHSRLKLILAHFEEMDQKLKKVKKGWNDLVTEGPHATIVQINQYKIPEDSIYNKEIAELMQKLLSEKTSLVEGVELVKANKVINYIKNSTVFKTEDFIQPFYCEKNQSGQLCHIKKWGTLKI
ncbi:MAG: hypothetical protein ACOVP4_06735 [Bacteriovoracaceae bacterium]